MTEAEARATGVIRGFPAHDPDKAEFTDWRPAWADEPGKVRDLGSRRTLVILRTAGDRIGGVFRGVREVEGGPKGVMTVADIDAERIIVAETPEDAEHEWERPTSGAVSLVCSGMVAAAIDELTEGEPVYVERTSESRDIGKGQRMTVYRILSKRRQPEEEAPPRAPTRSTPAPVAEDDIPF